MPARTPPCGCCAARSWPRSTAPCESSTSRSACAAGGSGSATRRSGAGPGPRRSGCGRRPPGRPPRVRRCAGWGSTVRAVGTGRTLDEVPGAGLGRRPAVQVVAHRLPARRAFRLTRPRVIPGVAAGGALGPEVLGNGAEQLLPGPRPPVCRPAGVGGQPCRGAGGVPGAEPLDQASTGEAAVVVPDLVVAGGREGRADVAGGRPERTEHLLVGQLPRSAAIARPAVRTGRSPGAHVWPPLVVTSQ